MVTNGIINYSSVKSKVLVVLFSLLGTYLTFPVFFERLLFSINDYSQNWLSLDPSWILALTQAFSKNLVFGSEFALTYGPLGFLTSRLLLGINKYYLLGFDVFVALNFFFMFYCSLIRSASKRQVLMLIALCIISLPVFYGAGTSILLMAIQLFWLTEFLTNQKNMALIASMLVSGLLLFMKFNTGFITFFLLFLVIAYNFITQPNSRKQLMLLSITFFLLLTISFRFLNVSPWPYFKTGLMMIEGYGDLMFLDQEKYLELNFGIFCLIACLALLMYCLVKLKVKAHLGLIVLLLYSIPAYVLYKQGFTRADRQHIQEFYAYFPMLLMAFPQFFNRQLAPDVNYLVFIPAFICCSFAIQTDQNVPQRLIQRMFKSNYIKAFSTYSSTSGNRIDSTQNQLPLVVKNKIARAKIDAYPWNLIELYENKLNVSTRPIIQSYTAYTKELEQINAAHYDSERAPEFVLYDYASIDNRYPLSDEPLLNLRLFNNYSVCDTLHSYGSFKLLLKKTNTAKIKLLPSKTYEISTDSKIIPKADTYYEIVLKKTLKGKLQSLLWHSPQLVLQIMNGNKDLYEYHTSVQLLESGFFSNIHYNTTYDVLNMYSKSTIDKNNKVFFYGVRELDFGCFENKMTIKEYKIVK